MEINPLRAVDFSVPSKAPANSPGNSPSDRQIVSAVQRLNKSSSLELDRELTYRRDAKTGHLIIQIVNRASRDVIDQIPTEALLRLEAELQQTLKPETPPSNEPGFA